MRTFSLLLSVVFPRHDILPIAMGAREEDYQRSAPYKSYLHVDQFEDPQQLAKFLHQLDQNDDLYNQYFQVDKIYMISARKEIEPFP